MINSALAQGVKVEDTFTITELAEEFEITPRTIRFYEDKALLTPGRQGLSRIYTRRDRARLKLILRGRRVGFSLAEIKEMIDLYELGDDPEERVRLALDRSIARMQELKRQRQDIEEMIGELQEGIESIHRWLAEKAAGRSPAKPRPPRRAARGEMAEKHPGERT